MLKKLASMVIGVALMLMGAVCAYATPSSTINLTVTIRDTVPPSIPQGLNAQALDGAVKLTWTANTETDLAGYNIYRATVSGGPYIKVNPSLVTSHQSLDTNLANNTTYYYVITSIDIAGNESVYSTQAGAKPIAWITGLSVSPNAFSPNADGTADISTINYNLAVPGSVTLKIYDSTNNLVRILLNSVSTQSGANSAVWDGKNDGGTVGPDGIYTYKIDAVDANNNPAQQKTGTLTVDNHPLSIVSPAIGTVLNNTVTVKAQPSAYAQFSPNPGSVYFFWRLPGEAGGWVWSKYIGLGVKQSDGTWQANWDTTARPNGAYEVTAMVAYTDLNGANRSEQVFLGSYTITNSLIITGVSAAPNAFSPNADGAYDAANINYLITQPARVTVKIYDSANTLIRTLKNSLSESSGAQTAVWNGKNDAEAIVADGQYTYRIDAIDTNNNPAAQKTGTLAIDNHFIQVAAPPAGRLSGTVTFKAVPSAYAQVNDPVWFFWRPQGTSGWSWSRYVGPGVKQSDGSWTVSWNSVVIANGDYEINVLAGYTDLNGSGRTELSPSTVYTIANGLVITGLSAAPNAFSPNNDGTADTAAINYTLTTGGWITVKIYDSTNNLVSTPLNNVNQPAGANSVVWDGKDTGNQVLPDGIYTYKIDGLDFSNNPAVQKSGTLTIDNHALVLLSPANGTSLNGTVTFKVSGSSYAQIPDSGSVYFFWRLPGEAGGWVWSKYIGMGVKQSGGTWQVSWDTTPRPNGAYEVTAMINYTDLNGSSRSEQVFLGSYTVTNDPVISGLSATPNAFSPNADGTADAGTINYSLNLPSQVNLTLYDAANNLVRTLIDDVSQPAGANSVVWDGKSDGEAVQPDGVYTYKIDATDTNNNPAPQKRGTIAIDNHALTIILPAVNSTISGKVLIKAKSSPYAQVTNPVYFFWCPQGTIGWNWSRYIGLGVKQPDNTWQVNWDSANVANGNYEVTAIAPYTDLNNASRNELVLLGNYTITNSVDISGLTVTPNPFSPDETGTWIDPADGQVYQDPAPGRILDDIAQISFNASAAGCFDIKILDGNGWLMRQLNKGLLTPDSQTGIINLAWNGNDDAGHKVANGTYTLVVTPPDVAKQLTAQVIVDKISFATNVKVSPTTFSPNNITSNTATITFNLSDNAYLTLEVYDSSQALVRTLATAQLTNAGPVSYIWDGKNDAGTILPAGHYRFKISTRSEHGNSGDPAYADVIISSVANAKVSSDNFNPHAGGSVTFDYDISQDAVLNVKVLDQASNAVVRTLVNAATRSAGTHSEVWDGKDDIGQIAPDGAYVFLIEDVSSGQPIPIYDPRGTGGQNISRSATFAVSSLNRYNNEFAVMDYTLPVSALVKIKVRNTRYTGPNIKTIKYYPPEAAGPHQAFWDGRDETGDFADTSAFNFTLWVYNLDDNSVIITGGTPQLSDVYLLPVSFKPYSISRQADDASPAQKISFTLDKPANVTISIYDSSGGLVRSILSDTSCPVGQSEYFWDGMDDSGDYVFNGDYRIIIQAHDGQNYSDAVTLYSQVWY